MKKKAYRIIPLILCAAIVGTPAIALAEGNAPATEDTAATKSSVTKDESVYCILNPDGSLKEQTVSCWLHADGGVRAVTDISDLTNIINVKSATKPGVEGKSIKWDSDETDIYYTGTSVKTPPLSVQITYQFNGQDISAQDLIGKSGQVTIKIHLTNSSFEEKTISGITRKIYTPLAAAVVVNLPSKNFKNIQAGDSQIITESTNQVVTFVSMPGLKENFSGILTDELSNLMDKASDTMTITAQSENFSMPMIAIAAATNLADLKDINLDDKVSKLTDGLSQLTDATADLKDGTSKLSQALNEFDSKMTELKTNYNSFNNGITKAFEGAKELETGTAKLKAAAAILKGTVNDQLIPGITGSAALESQLKTKMADLQTQLAGFDTTALQASIVSALGSVYDLSSQQTIAILTSGGTLSSVTTDEQNQIAAAKSTVVGTVASHINLSALSTLQSSLTDIETLSSKLMGSMDVLTGSLYNPNDKDLSNPKTLANAIIALSMGADSVENGTSSLKSGLSDLSDASAKIEDAIAQFKSGTDTLNEKTGELDNGMAKFKKEGVDEINKDNLTNDLETAMQINDAMHQQADKFVSYSGAPEGVKNSIRFIMKTDGIEKQKTADTEQSQKPKEENVWDKIGDFFKGIFNIK